MKLRLRVHGTLKYSGLSSDLSLKKKSEVAFFFEISGITLLCISKSSAKPNSEILESLV